MYLSKVSGERKELITKNLSDNSFPTIKILLAWDQQNFYKIQIASAKKLIQKNIAEYMTKKRFNVGILFYGPFPWNRGIGQLYSMVEELGNNVYIFSAFPEERYLNQKSESYRTFHFRKSNSILQKIMTFHIPFNFLWEIWLMKMCRRLQIDFLFVRETPLSFIAQRIALKLKIPIVLDMRENLPEVYSSERSKKLPIPSNFQYHIASKFESFVLPRFDHIFTVSEELKKLVSRKYAIQTKRISVLCNYPQNSYLESVPKIQNRTYIKKKSSIKLVFAGEISKNRGLQDIIASLCIIPEDVRPNLTIIGEGSYLDVLRNDVRRLNLDNYVVFTPLLPPEALPDKLSQFDIGVCSYRINEQTQHTMPGKLFEYMAAGLAILSSERKPVKRIVDETKCGLIYNSTKPQVIAHAILELTADYQKLLNMGLRAQTAIFERYNSTANLNVLESVFKWFSNYPYNI